VLEELLLRSQPTTSHGDSFDTSISGTAARDFSDDIRANAHTQRRRYGATATAERDPSHKGFGDNRRGRSADGEDPQRTNQRTVAGSAGEARDASSGDRVAGGMGRKFTHFAPPAAAAKRRPSEAGESQYQR
jgi:hypothetical protein